MSDENRGSGGRHGKRRRRDPSAASRDPHGRTGRDAAATGSPAHGSDASRPVSRDAAKRPGGAEPDESPFLTGLDLHLYCEGTHRRAWEKLGAHLVELDGAAGAKFAVWAPNAAEVSVIGDFNEWKHGESPLAPLGGSGVWEGFVPGVGHGARYKYSIRSKYRGHRGEKADPFATAQETRPQTASIAWDLRGFEWGDADWMERRAERNGLGAPISIYEVHLGSWMRVAEEDDRWLTYRELAPKLAAYARELGFTHVELLPVSEHPFDGSWGYQPVGYFAPTSRFGTPHDFMHLVDTLHRSGIGVILDWVPAHFPRDAHGLGYFDGTHLYEHADPRKGVHRDWDTLIFNYGRPEVRSFLISNALYWLEVFHVDGLRVDAVASMLYLDYSRGEGEWVPNEYGGRENLEAVDFLKQMNEAVHTEHPGALTIAEESTAWPMVSRPVHLGGLGFSMKWNMGWMHDTLHYASVDPLFRIYHHHHMTFSLMYAFSENFVLPLSHDEVVHGKGSLLNKMPGDRQAKLAHLRLLYGYMWAHPGKKLLFMGGEFGQEREWNHDRGLDWDLLRGDAGHAGLERWVGDLNRLLRAEPALHERDFDSTGFEWIDCNDSEHSVLSLVRWDAARMRPVVAVFNFTPVVRHAYRIGVPVEGEWREVLNSDAAGYGGGGQGNSGELRSESVASHGRPQSLVLTLPPLGALLLRPAEETASTSTRIPDSPAGRDE
jgi:1,4-alpha-glucan branching enzyme